MLITLLDSFKWWLCTEKENTIRNSVSITVFCYLVNPSHRDSAAAAAAKSLQSSLTLCDPIDRSPPGYPVTGILQARTLEWVAISFSNAWKWKVKVKSLSHVRLLATPWTVAHQAPPSMGFSRQEYWSGCHCLFPETQQRLPIKHSWITTARKPDKISNPQEYISKKFKW